MLNPPKQILNRVTITGADDSIEPRELLQLSNEFPFVEWGILMSKSQVGNARFPSPAWLRDLEDISPDLNLSAHLCGRVVRKLLLGDDELWAGWQRWFKRAQLNFHAEATPWDPLRFATALRAEKYKHLQWIFQIDGASGNEYVNAVRDLGTHIDVVELFDLSGGAGVLPWEWPKGDGQHRYRGYAGGLSPDNVVEQLAAIETVAQPPCWIDVETHVRSERDTAFDLAKVRAFLEAARPWVIE